MEYVIVYSSKKILDASYFKTIVKNTIYIDRDSISKKYGEDLYIYLKIWFSDDLAEKLKQKDFIIVEKEKGNSILSLAKTIGEEIKISDIDIKKISNDIRYEAMKRFFDEYEYEYSKSLKERLENIKNEIDPARRNYTKYLSLQGVVNKVLKIQEEIRMKDISDDKSFSDDIAEKFSEARRFKEFFPPL